MFYLITICRSKYLYIFEDLTSLVKFESAVSSVQFFLQSVWKVLSTKVEIKLKKKDGHHWSKLEGDGLDPLRSASAISKTDTAFKSTKGRDWSKIERDIEKVKVFFQFIK
jgi:hypothetical protein